MLNANHCRNHRALLAFLQGLTLLGLTFAGHSVYGQEGATLEEIIVTAQRRVERLQDVPISVATLSGERLDALFEGGEDIRALATRVPSLYAESSNGRLAPRFYIRGLGNTDFDLAASQSVSVLVDEVVQENVLLKSFPLFDIARVEVLRGPQGTLFGRNTPAGMVKFDTRKPAQDFSAHLTATLGSLNTKIFEGAIGGGLSDQVSVRASLLFQDVDDWIENIFTGESDALGGFRELAWRLQGLWDVNEDLSLLLNVHGRHMSNGTASIFRANILTAGDNGLNSNFIRDKVAFDEGDNNPQEADALGSSLKVEYDFGNDMTFTSITAFEGADNSSLGDIDGGFGASFLPVMGPGFIPFPAVTRDGIDDLDQFTQEFRVSSNASETLFWQAGFFYFDSDFTITTEPFFVAGTTLTHENTAWAVFGQASLEVSDALTITGGIRYTDDDKDLSVAVSPIPTADVSVDDQQISWDLSALYTVNDTLNVYGRVASGFRAPTIQARDVAFFGSPSTADSETIISYEAGFKAELMENRLRLNGSVFYYQIDDQQFSAIGGVGNFVQLVNADQGTGIGFDLDGELLVGEHLMFTAGVSYNDTELEDSSLRVAPCGSGQCTVRDPLDVNGNAIVDGNPFPQAPDWIYYITARYTTPLGDNAEFFIFTDWAYQGETHFFLYESEEYFSENNYEGGLRVGYSYNNGQYEWALFARNITDEENLKGGIDFNNNTGFVNEPRVVGISFKARY